MFQTITIKMKTTCIKKKTKQTPLTKHQPGLLNQFLIQSPTEKSDSMMSYSQYSNKTFTHTDTHTLSHTQTTAPRTLDSKVTLIQS